MASDRRGVQRGDTVRDGLRTLVTWPPRRWIAAAIGAVVAALLTGVPTGVVATSLYTRMTPVTWWDYPVWAVSAVLVGLIVATYVPIAGARPEAPDRSRRTIGATVLTTLAVGCPVCNKLVVGLIGVSGALNYWAPLQPALGLLGIGLLGTALAVRLRGAVACRARPAVPA